MVAIVAGSINISIPPGDVDTRDDPVWDFAGASNVDAAIGAFTNKGGLPEDIDSLEGWEAFAFAMLTKSTGVYDGGITVTNYSANRFTGVGGGGDDRFEVHNNDVVRMDGRDGDDTLSVLGQGTSDTLNGGAGDDGLSSLSGNDRLDGGAGDDTMDAGQGDDTLTGGAGVDTVDYASTGSATVDLSTPDAQDTGMFGGTDVLAGIEHLRGGNGADSFTGDDGDNRLDGAGNSDTLAGGEGDDTLIGGAGRNTMDGGAGFDWISFADTPGSMTALLYSNTILRNGSATTNVDHASGVEGIIGSAFVDDLAGDSARNAIRAGDSDDTVQGMEESDTLDGGAGADGVYGNEGSDVIVGGEGDDTLDGGADTDFADYRTAAAGVTVDLTIAEHQATVGAGSDKLVSIENLLGSQFRDDLAGDDGANRLEGRGGKDTLSGADGADTLVGGFGKDVFVGGTGADEMSGGPNKDRFISEAISDSTKAAPDLITDLANDDRILLTAIDANVTKAGNQAFDLVADFTGKAGQAVLRYDAVNDETRLLLDNDGDAVADGAILFDGNHLDFTNFAL